MSDTDYATRHIPHRMNLLVTFRERYRCDSDAYLNPEVARDIFRCSKDISLLMVRFLLNEMGIYLPKKDLKKKPNRDNDIQERRPTREGIQRLTVEELKADPRFFEVLEVLKAANRAVAHIESGDVEHSFRTDTDSKRLFDAIDFVEEQVRSKIYGSNRFQQFQYSEVMQNRDNDMRRVKLVQAD